MPEAERELELRLVRQAKSGNEDAFGGLYDLYAASIFRFLLGNLANPQEAEDLTTEVFIRVWRALPEYEDAGYPFSAYLFRVARNLLIDTYRSHGRNEPLISIEDAGLEEILQDPEQKLPDPSEYDALHRALQALREDYREVLVLRFLNDLSVEEISVIMNRSEGAVRVLQHRALNAVRNIIGTAGD